MLRGRVITEAREAFDAGRYEEAAELYTASIEERFTNTLEPREEAAIAVG